MYWHYPHFSNQLGRPAGAVRKGDFKLVENYETNGVELYNLKEDISEAKDISRAFKTKTMEMHKLLIEWRVSVNAQMPLPNPEYKKIDFKITELRTFTEAQGAPSPYGVFNLIWNGKILADRYISTTRFENIIRRWNKGADNDYMGI